MTKENYEYYDYTKAENLKKLESIKRIDIKMLDEKITISDEMLEIIKDIAKTNNISLKNAINIFLDSLMEKMVKNAKKDIMQSAIEKPIKTLKVMQEAKKQNKSNKKIRVDVFYDK